MSESELVRDILVAVSAMPGAMAWRNNSFVGRTQTGAFLRASVPGAPDILGVHLGRAIGIEAKTARGRQSEQQRRFQIAFERAGGLYILARSVDDVREALYAAD